MGLFSRNKKNGMFDKNIEPKCAYCENGKPARSKGKILCPRCGIVEGDYSCKKFKYSPFLRIPERRQETVEESAEAVTEPEDNVSVSETAKQPTESSAETNEPAEKEAHTDAETVSENLPPAPSENSAEELSNETQTDDVDVSEPEQEKTETPFPAYICVDEDEPDPVPETEPEKPDESKLKSVIYAEGEGKTNFVKAEISESESQQGSFSNINNKPKDNSENIAKLKSVPKPSVSSIDNYIQPIEINLPKISESAVSSIENKPPKRDSEAYLKTISVGNVSEIENHVDNVHNSSSDV